MVNELGLSPTTSTVEHVKRVLQQAIAQEEAVIQTASSRASYYKQQLEALTTLESVPDAAPTVEPGSNETATATNNGTLAASKAVPLLSAQPPKRTGGRSAAKQKQPATQSPAKSPAKFPAKSPTKPPGKSAAKATAPDAETTVPEPVDLPKVLSRFRGKTMIEAITTVLSEQPETSLDYKQITELLYGSAVLKDELVQKRVSRVVSAHLIRGADKRHWKKAGLNPTVYQYLLPSEVAAVTKS